LTARPGRRRRSTLLGGLAATGALVLTAVLTVVGAQALWTSTGGRAASEAPPELSFPVTPALLLGGVDPGGALASLAVVVLRPDGRGGSIVTAPVTIDASSGEGDERLPVAETAALSGLEAVEAEAGIALGLSFDSVELADAARLTALLVPFGDVAVDLPADVTDAAGEVVAAAGSHTLDAAALAAVLTARNPAQPGAEAAAATAAVWEAIAAAITAQGDEGDEGDEGAAGAAESGSPEAILAGLGAGPVATWALSSTNLAPERNPRDVDVAVLDRTEVALVFGQIAPAKVSASNPSASFRLVAAFTPAQLGDRGWTAAEVAYQATSQVLFLRGNVLSVDTTPGEAPATTGIEIMQTGLNTDGMPALFGELDVSETDQRIVGVDAVLTLGETYLRFLDEAVDEGLVTVGAGPVDETVPDDVEPTEATASADN